MLLPTPLLITDSILYCQQRMTGFAICFGTGYLVTFMSFSFFIQLVEGE